jgi:NAD+ synthetase
MISEVALREKIPVVQVNVVGGNDELVFDGQSLMVDAQGRMLARGNAFDEDLLMGNPFSDEPLPETGHQPSAEEEIFYALALGTGDYVRKCGFQKVAIGLSGGIDSALTAVIAVEALGNENVLGVLMPGPYSSEGSLKDARALAEVLEIKTMTLPIGEPFEAVSKQLQPVLGGLLPDSTEENLQSRLRGVTLMAISNKQNRLVLTTGNKSELAVGYCTLYGDMCGGLAVISDLPKMMVYSLSRWINRHGEIIPWPTLDKAPSAELRPNQTDQDSLPPYDILDAIVEGYVVRGETPSQIAAAGIDLKVVHDIIRKIDLNEYKRRQAAPGLKVTTKAFGIGRRMPIAQRFRRG